MITLGIETSCDDTAMALYSPSRGLIAELTSRQLEHELYGGVVPEIASRAHVRTILGVFEALLERAGLERGSIGGVGVSNGPGLVGSLLVGVSFAKGLALGLGVPLVGVHHLEAHIFANELRGEPLSYPCVVLVVSGGHTSLYHVEDVGRYRLVGSTRDDAAGEAFDKIGKLLGLGYPGGPAVEKLAAEGRRDAVDFPRAMMAKDDYNFSFSGLKTAVRLEVEERSPLDRRRAADIAASAQEAIVDVLVDKTVGYARSASVPHVYLAGGVAANGYLRARMEEACRRAGIVYHAPAIEHCTDNGAMVAVTAWKHLSAGRNGGLALDVFARGHLASWR